MSFVPPPEIWRSGMEEANTHICNICNKIPLDKQANCAIICNVYMGLEQGRPQQFFMPDTGTGRPGGGTRQKRELQQAIQVMKDHKPLNVLSTEPKVDPSSPLPKPISSELKRTVRSIEKKSRHGKRFGK